MANVEIKTVASKSDLKKFIKLPWKIYRGDKNWAPPLIMDMKKLLNREKNPFFQHSEAEYFLAFKNGELVGRIAAILNNRHNEFHEEKTGFFGFFESIEDQEVAAALLNKAETWVRGKKQGRIRGPMNFSTNDTCGMLIENFDEPPLIMMTYNPAYYNRFFDTFSYTKAQDLLAYKQYTAAKLNPRLQKIAEAAKSREDLTVRHLNMKRFWDDVEIIKKVYNDAWSKNWGFVPMTDAEIHHLAKDLKPVVDPRYVFIIEIKGDPVAFALSLPDFNQALIKINGRLFPFGLPRLLYYSRKINVLRNMILGVVQEYQKNSGLGALLYSLTWDMGEKTDILYGEFSWILESNKAMNAAAKNMGGTVYKRYRIYEKEFL
ncbi:MAG: N-acetyltransferase [bacterium]